MFHYKLMRLVCLIAVLFLMLMALPGAVAAQEDQPVGTPAPEVTIVQEDSGLTVQNVIYIIGGVVVLGLIAFGLHLRGELKLVQSQLSGQVNNRYARLDANPAMLAFGQSPPGQLAYAGMDALIDQVDDPDDPFVQGLVTTLLKVSITQVLLRRYPKLKEDQHRLEQLVSLFLTKLLKAVRDLFDGKVGGAPLVAAPAPGPEEVK